MASPSKQDLIALAKNQARQAGIDDAHVPIFLGMIEQESNWNPRATGPETRFGRAKGLGQLIDSTAKSLGVSDPYDPAESLRGAATYFSQQLRRFGGDAGLALAAYNWGPANAAKLAEKPSSVRIPSETQKYVPKIFEKSLAYGGNVAPTNFVSTLFPKVADVAKTAVASLVGSRYATQPDQIERAIQTGNVPGAARPTPAPSLATEGDITTGGLPPLAESGALPAMAEAQPTSGVRPAAGIASMDEFLKRSFGPLADIADPFPKGFDKELMRIIDEA
jgi:hypothetical protein